MIRTLGAFSEKKISSHSEEREDKSEWDSK